MKSLNWHPKVIEDYLVTWHKFQNTRDTVRVYLKKYFTTIDITPTEYHKRSKKKIENDIQKYVELIENEPVKTQNTALSIIKKYLERKKVDVPSVRWEEWRMRNGLKRNASTVKKATPTANDIKKILAYSNIKSRSLFTFCAASGARIDEALGLTFDDIDLEKREVDILEDIAKDHIPRYSFFTPEAKEQIELWLPEREKMLQSRYKKSKYLRDKLVKIGYRVERIEKQPGFFTWKIYNQDKELSKKEIINLDNRIWPFDYVNAHRMWIGMLEKAGDPYNKKDKNPKLQSEKYLYNIHCLRRFWITELPADRMNPEAVNYIGGHMSLLDRDYKNFEAERWRRLFKEDYDNHMGCICIFESSPGTTERIDDLEARNKELERKIESYRDDMLNMLTKQYKEKKEG